MGDDAYQDGARDVSWFQERPSVSLELIGAAGASLKGGVIDIGGGASALSDSLLAEGYINLAVLDLSARALGLARARLGERASAVEWFGADVRTFDPPYRFAVWQDRAAFHFLTNSEDRRCYRATLSRTVDPDGHVVLATFELDGRQKCSGLDVVRYGEKSIQEELGPEFLLRNVARETHVTRWKPAKIYLLPLRALFPMTGSQEVNPTSVAAGASRQRK